MRGISGEVQPGVALRKTKCAAFCSSLPRNTNNQPTLTAALPTSSFPLPPCPPPPTHTHTPHHTYTPHITHAPSKHTTPPNTHSTQQQTKAWKAYISFPRCTRDLFSNTLLLVGLPKTLLQAAQGRGGGGGLAGGGGAGMRANEAALLAALSRYGKVVALQVRWKCKRCEMSRGSRW